VRANLGISAPVLRKSGMCTKATGPIPTASHKYLPSDVVFVCLSVLSSLVSQSQLFYERFVLVPSLLRLAAR
jgi:hypothetical protein